MAGGSEEYMMSGMDDNSTGDGKTGKLSSGRHNVWNSGFNGKLTCPKCNDGNIGKNSEITEVTDGIDLPTDERYYDKYNYSTSDTTYNRGFLGDATKEMGPVQNMKYLSIARSVDSGYNDKASFVNSNYPWIMRSGVFSEGSNSGLFSFVNASGSINENWSFRLVLAF